MIVLAETGGIVSCKRKYKGRMIILAQTKDTHLTLLPLYVLADPPTSHQPTQPASHHQVRGSVSYRTEVYKTGGPHVGRRRSKSIVFL
jgi:hypothetical protein